jgi:hypothetical protein
MLKSDRINPGLSLKCDKADQNQLVARKFTVCYEKSMAAMKSLFAIEVNGCYGLTDSKRFLW